MLPSISQNEFQAYRKNITPLLWLIIPALMLIIQLGVDLFLSEDVAGPFFNENGGAELAQSAIMLCALLASISAIGSVCKISGWFIKFWLGIACLGCLYVTGEELSWGQHFFGWQSGEFWSDVNDQQETNLHNTSSWLDQKPRLLIEIGILTGGLIIPALIKWAPHLLPKQLWLIFPNALYIPTALMYLLVKLGDKLVEIDGDSPFTRGSEILETFMFYFILIYLLDFRKRVKSCATNTTKLEAESASDTVIKSKAER